MIITHHLSTRQMFPKPSKKRDSSHIPEATIVSLPPPPPKKSRKSNNNNSEKIDLPNDEYELHQGEQDLLAELSAGGTGLGHNIVINNGLGGGGGGGFDLDLDDDGEVVNIDDIYKKHLQSDVECWGCIHNFGPSRRPGQDVMMEKLYQEYEMNRTWMEPGNLFKYIQELWEDCIYHPQTKAGFEVEFWDVETVELHLCKHIFDRIASLQYDVRKAGILAEELSRTMLRSRAGGVIAANEQQHKQYERQCKIKNDTFRLLMQAIKEDKT